MIDWNQYKEVKVCQGTIYRADVYQGKTSRGIGFYVRLNEIKKYSCKGCETCGWQNDYLQEVNKDWPILDLENAVHGKLYRLTTVNESKDWETGYVDEFDLKIIEYKESNV